MSPGRRRQGKLVSFDYRNHRNFSPPPPNDEIRPTPSYPRPVSETPLNRWGSKATSELSACLGI